MAKTIKPGSDAASIQPKLIPDFELLPRDDSGGPDYQPRNATFGDGGVVVGAKAHLSASGGSDDQLVGTEQASDRKARVRNDKRDGGSTVTRKMRAESAD